MLVYRYDGRTREYIGTDTAYLDPVATRKAGEKVYAFPACTTDIKPPRTQKGEVAVFEKGEWKVVKDYRGYTVYNVATREGKVWTEVGELPKEYAFKLPERLDELKSTYLKTMKSNFNVCMSQTKINIPSTDLYFAYTSLERLKNEQALGLQMSRDDNNKIYSLTRQEYDAIINYMVIYGQYMYLQKWAVENLIKKCTDVELLKTYKQKLEFEVDPKFINKIAKMSVDGRKEFFSQMANNIK